MSLIEEVQKLLDHRQKSHSIALAKLWEIQREVAALAKLSGHLESYYEGFSYYVPEHGGCRSRLAIKCYVEGDQTRLVYVSLSGEEETSTVTYEPLDKLITGMAYKISFRFAREGRYKI